MDETVRYAKAVQPKIYSRELVELIFTQPYCRIGDLVENGIASRNIAAKYLKELAAAGVRARFRITPCILIAEVNETRLLIIISLPHRPVRRNTLMQGPSLIIRGP